MTEIKKGMILKHFKGHIIEVLEIAKHTETMEELVIYKHLETGDIWARPKSMFYDKVDREKYPDIKQEYRFEMLNNKSKETI